MYVNNVILYLLINDLVSYLRLRRLKAQSVQCWRAGGRYWAQAETALCSPALLWSGATCEGNDSKQKINEVQMQNIKYFIASILTKSNVMFSNKHNEIKTNEKQK